ncbi:MAG: ComEC/Rec2 family competence protein [Eubacteriales bacterium]
MILGDSSDIDDEMLTAFRNTGIAHLLAVSGLHVSLLAAAFSLLFRRNAWVRFAAVAAFCALYAAITAFSRRWCAAASCSASAYWRFR